MSAAGEVRVERAYYHCRACRAGHCPRDAALRLGAGDLTPGAQEVVTLAGLLTSFAEAAEKVLPKLAGLRLAESTAERTAEAAGTRLAERLAAGRTVGPKAAWEWPADARGVGCAYVSVDATGVGIQGPDGAAAEGRMAWVGLVFAPTPDGRCRASRASAGLFGLAELGVRMRRQAGQVGLDAAGQQVALTDGGAGLEDFMRVNFPRAECVLDFYHAAEHLNALAQAVYGPGDAAAAAAADWCHALKHEGGAALLARLEALDVRHRSAAVRESYRQEVGYVRGNVHRMDYPRYRANGWLIGSGHIEAACKSVVGQRLKGNGMRWSEAGANAVCHLRALFKSEAGQWDAFWATAA